MVFHPRWKRLLPAGFRYSVINRQTNNLINYSRKNVLHGHIICRKFQLTGISGRE